MTRVYITIDTEYSAGHARRHGLDGAARAENFARSIACRTAQNAVGVEYQMDRFDRHGLKAVFFVDPMPGLVWGVEAVADVVGPIVARGHDVQLHLHTEWLELAGSANPLGTRTGLNIADFAFEDQCRLIDLARGLLVAAGAPPPVCFRAGNYGANDDTLRALAELGLSHDTSHPPGIAGSLCRIGLGPDDRLPVERLGITEVPIAAIAARGRALRHAQITALSAGELLAAIAHAHDHGLADFTLVSHSFELLSRNRQAINRVVRRRFEAFCAGLAALPGVRTATYAAEPPAPCAGPAPVLPHAWPRTLWRLAEQAVSNQFWGEKA